MGRSAVRLRRTAALGQQGAGQVLRRHVEPQAPEQCAGAAAGAHAAMRRPRSGAGASWYTRAVPARRAISCGALHAGRTAVMPPCASALPSAGGRYGARRRTAGAAAAPPRPLARLSRPSSQPAGQAASVLCWRGAPSCVLPPSCAACGGVWSPLRGCLLLQSHRRGRHARVRQCRMHSVPRSRAARSERGARHTTLARAGATPGPSSSARAPLR